MFLSSGDGYLGKILEFPKRVKNPFEFQEGTWAFYEIAAVSKGLLKRAGENFKVCLELWQEE